MLAQIKLTDEKCERNKLKYCYPTDMNIEQTMFVFFYSLLSRIADSSRQYKQCTFFSGVTMYPSPTKCCTDIFPLHTYISLAHFLLITFAEYHTIKNSSVTAAGLLVQRSCSPVEDAVVQMSRSPVGAAVGTRSSS